MLPVRAQKIKMVTVLLLKYTCHTLPIPKEKDRPKGLLKSLKRLFQVFYWSIAHYYAQHSSYFVYLLVGIGLVSLSSRYEFFYLLKPAGYIHSIYYMIWSTVFISDVICLWLYINVLIHILTAYGRYLESWQLTRKKYGLILPLSSGFFCLLISCYSIYYSYSDISRWNGKFHKYMLPSYWFYKLLMYSRIAQNVLSCLIISLSVPVTRYWLRLMSPQIRESMLHILPWYFFNKFERLLTLATMQSVITKSTYTELFLRFIVLQGFLLYIPSLSLTIANTYVFPILHNPNTDQKIVKGKVYHGNLDLEPLRAMVTGVTTPVVDYPSRTELVRGASSERFKNFLQPAHSSRQLDNSMQDPRGSAGSRGETVRTNAPFSFTRPPDEGAAGDTIDDVPIISDEKEATEKREEVQIGTIEEETEEELKEEEDTKHKEKEESTQDEREIHNDDVLQNLDLVEIDYASVVTEASEEIKELLVVNTDEDESLHPSPIDQQHQ
ncbi:PREDICTED: uncharacterized protein LOC109580195 [Amphimedon queenslandica]|uniref:Uncharacterized protein n=1 Tax=Amphimedon queenslandica TaxID=400682 RepID=A0A1X7VIQ8_AMPQE|nr:PREDICTED: uncharacterized protein LOC109580195 [Amphimedon queenslandica]|eukprot:XP_019848658.1 PREDICTED: uncharacterized protein LOC109580195 [Amphimedon queenslandica]